MRLKQGTKIELQREICQICQISFSSDSMQFPCDFRDLKKRETDHGPTDGWTDRPSYRDAWTHLKLAEYSLVKISFFPRQNANQI